MELTRKCEEDFEKWYLKYIKSNSQKIISNTDVNYFNLLTKSMQYGVLVDYFDSVGIEIEIYKDYDLSDTPATFIGWIFFIEDYNGDKWFKTRAEARTASIEKANELRNKVLNK
tara:strand:- start:85 stop:426 length:342 start_codon:yes stop_codon:yes gene_type:complete